MMSEMLIEKTRSTGKLQGCMSLHRRSIPLLVYHYTDTGISVVHCACIS